jgi:hypothetical protein
MNCARFQSAQSWSIRHKIARCERLLPTRSSAQNVEARDPQLWASIATRPIVERRPRVTAGERAPKLPGSCFVLTCPRRERRLTLQRQLLQGASTDQPKLIVSLSRLNESQGHRQETLK